MTIGSLADLKFLQMLSNWYLASLPKFALTLGVTQEHLLTENVDQSAWKPRSVLTGVSDIYWVPDNFQTLILSEDFK